MLQMNIYEEFSRWLDDLLEINELPDSTKAICFNLYAESEEENLYSAQIACDMVWSSEENVFIVDTSDEDDTGWKHAQDLFKEMVEEYFRTGKYGRILRSFEGAAIGFVDGDLELLDLN